MKKIISILTLACFALLLPIGLVGCKKSSTTLEGTWVFKNIEFLYYDKLSEDTNVFTNDKNVDLNAIFGTPQDTLTFNSDGSGFLSQKYHDEDDQLYTKKIDFTWEKATLDNQTIEWCFGKKIKGGNFIKIQYSPSDAVNHKDEDDDTYFLLFENGKLSSFGLYKLEDPEKDINNIHVKYVFEKK